MGAAAHLDDRFVDLVVEEALHLLLRVHVEVADALVVRCARTPLAQLSSLLVAYSDAKVANRYVRDSGWEIAHEAVSRRPPSSLYTTVASTEGYTYDASFWYLSIVQGRFLSPRAKP